MDNKEKVQLVSDELTARSKVLIEEGHPMSAMMQSAYSDFKSLGSLSGMLSIMATGKLSQQQIIIVERIAVKVLAVLGILKVAPEVKQDQQERPPL